MNTPGALSVLFMLAFAGSVLGNLLAIYLLLTRPYVFIVKPDDSDANCDCGEGGHL